MVPIIGSMAIKGVFKAGSLISGLASTSGKLNEVQQRSKSTTTEMKRMTHGTNLLKGALAAIGVAGFSALLLTTPQLAGALAKIKTEMQLIAWSIGKHLKPVLDSVATILKGIRTGDWSTMIRGAKDLGSALLGLTSPVIDVIFGEGSAEKAKTDFNNWIETLKTAWGEGDLVGLIKTTLWDPANWLITGAYDWGYSVLGPTISRVVRGALDTIYIPAFDFGQRVAEHYFGEKGIWGAGGEFLKSGHTSEYWGSDKNKDEDVGEKPPSNQTGGYIPKTGLYKLHAGETVTMKGSSGMDFEKSAISSLSSTKNESIENINNDFRKFDTITNRNESTKNESIENINNDFRKFDTITNRNESTKNESIENINNDFRKFDTITNRNESTKNESIENINNDFRKFDTITNRNESTKNESIENINNDFRKFDTITNRNESTKNESIENINNDFRKFDTITNRNESTKNESIENINNDFRKFDTITNRNESTKNESIENINNDFRKFDTITNRNESTKNESIENINNDFRKFDTITNRNESTKNESIENINNDFRKFDTITNRNESTKNESIETTINVDFSGANINLASGIELDQFADAISMKIAERQQGLTY